ncbi:MAG: hypothetical protein KGI83_06610, partial [Verrucomicrobiota bacterium]|nr:hypothetical protein [Verrucomicrobiota bacterium]
MNVVPKYEDRYPFYKDREQYQVLIEAGFIDGGDGNLYVSQYVMPLSKLRPGSLEYRVVQAYEDWKNLSPYSDGRTEQRIQQEQIFAGTMGDLHRLQGDAYQAGLTRRTAYYNATLP